MMRVPSCSRHSRANGFTLVEVLVALVVTALLVAIIFDGLVSTRRAGKVASARRDAVLLAGHLTALASAGLHEPGTRQGREGTLSWRVTETTLMRDPRGFVALAAIETQVSDGDGVVLVDLPVRKLKALPRQ